MASPLGFKAINAGRVPPPPPPTAAGALAGAVVPRVRPGARVYLELLGEQACRVEAVYVQDEAENSVVCVPASCLRSQDGLDVIALERGQRVVYMQVAAARLRSHPPASWGEQYAAFPNDGQRPTLFEVLAGYSRSASEAGSPAKPADAPATPCVDCGAAPRCPDSPPTSWAAMTKQLATLSEVCSRLESRLVDVEQRLARREHAVEALRQAHTDMTVSLDQRFEAMQKHYATVISTTLTSFTKLLENKFACLDAVEAELKTCRQTVESHDRQINVLRSLSKPLLHAPVSGSAIGQSQGDLSTCPPWTKSLTSLGDVSSASVLAPPSNSSLASLQERLDSFTVTTHDRLGQVESSVQGALVRMDNFDGLTASVRERLEQVQKAVKPELTSAQITDSSCMRH